MTRFLKPRAVYLAGMGLLAIATVDLLRRFRKSDAGEIDPGTTTQQSPVTPRPAAAPPMAESKAQAKAQPAAKQMTAAKAVGGDDLTQIKGIGPTYAQRLRDAGLTTYADIANASADQLRDISRATGAAADPNEWITQARSLNGH